MIKFKLTENEQSVIDFDGNTPSGIVVGASMDDMRRWKRIMVQFNAIQPEMRRALDEGLGITEEVVQEPIVDEPAPEPPPQTTSNGTASRIDVPVESPVAPFHKPTSTLITQSVKVPEDNSSVETIAYNSKGYLGSGKLIMEATNVQPEPARSEVQPAPSGPATPIRQKGRAR